MRIKWKKMRGKRKVEDYLVYSMGRKRRRREGGDNAEEEEITEFTG